MSNQIETAFFRKYAAGIELLAQQIKSVLEPYVRVEKGEGEAQFYDQIGAVMMVEKTGRAVPIPTIDTPHSRRMVAPRDFYMRDFIDTFDRLKVFNDPANAYTEAFVAAGQRTKDKMIIDAALGDSATGKTGSEIVPFPAGNIVPEGGTGFTFAKVQEGIRILRSKNAIDQGEDVCCAYTSFQEKEFLNEDEVKSFDYNTMKALVEGEAGTFYTVHFKRIEDINTDASGRMLPIVATARRCLMWAKRGILLAKWKDIYGKMSFIDERESYQVMAGLSANATRMQESKVIAIDCKEP